MPKHSMLLVLIFCLISCLPGHAASAFTFTANYSVITGFGPVASFPRELRQAKNLFFHPTRSMPIVLKLCRYKTKRIFFS